MGQEHTLWTYMQPKMKPHWTASRIENAVERGMADVIYAVPRVSSLAATGWLELKAVSGPGVLIPWQSVDQPLFLNRWARAGMRSGLLVRDREDIWYYWRARKERWWLQWAQSVDIWDQVTWVSRGLNVVQLIQELAK